MLDHVLGTLREAGIMRAAALVAAEGGFVIFVSVWPKMKPDITKRVPRVIGIVYDFKSIKCVLHIIEGNIDFIIYLLLKIWILTKTNNLLRKEK